MALILSLLLATAFPSGSLTSWMRPESFHLTIGMPKSEVVRTLTDGGFKPRKGDHDRQMIVDFTPTKSLTLEFRKERLRSVRFELFTMANEIGGAFSEEKKYLRDTFGQPKAVASKSMVIYDGTLPNVMAVMTTDPKKGLGTLVVRYFDPARK